MPRVGQIENLRADCQSAEMCAGYNPITQVGEGIP
jgi:hypothetical protein